MKSPAIVACLATSMALAAAPRLAADELEDARAVAGSLEGNVAGQVRGDNALKSRLIWCPPGTVTMENIRIVGRVDDPERARRAPFVDANGSLTTKPRERDTFWYKGDVEND